MEAVKNAITRRIVGQHVHLLGTYGLEAVTEEIDAQAEFVGEVEEIGSSDVSCWVKSITERLERRPPRFSPRVQAAMKEMWK